MQDGEPGRLRAELGLGGAVVTGLGSILGTGVFVSIGIAAGVAGPSVVLAVAIAAMVAAANGMSSAQLAAAHPVAARQDVGVGAGLVANRDGPIDSVAKANLATGAIKDKDLIIGTGAKEIADFRPRLKSLPVIHLQVE